MYKEVDPVCNSFLKKSGLGSLLHSGIQLGSIVIGSSERNLTTLR